MAHFSRFLLALVAIAASSASNAQVVNNTPTPTPVPVAPLGVQPPATNTCVKCSISANLTPNDLRLIEGQVKIIKIALPESARNGIPAQVELKPGKGLVLDNNKFSFNAPGNQQEYTVYARVDTAAGLLTDAQVKLEIEWKYPSIPSCAPQTQTTTFTVQKTTCSKGWSVGDPHLLTLDQRYYDFYAAGVFKYLQSKNLDVQIATRKCNGGFVTCIYGVAFAMGDSVARLFIENNEVVFTKGTATLNDIQVKRRFNSYRVFVTADPSTYFDVNFGIIRGLGYLNVGTVVSQYFMGSATGLMGDGDGNPSNDDVNQASLVNKFRISSTDNLFTCVNGCAGKIQPLQEADRMKMAPIALLNEGYAAVSVASVPMRTHALEARRVLRNLEAAPDAALPELDEAQVRAQCDAVIRSIPLCDKYVPSLDLFIDSVCVTDTMAVRDIKNIDSVKLAYLRECRRGLDASIVQSEDTTAESKQEAKEDRAALSLANPSSCYNNCSGRGKCLMNGCECNKGFSGFGCEVELSAIHA